VHARRLGQRGSPRCVWGSLVSRNLVSACPLLTDGKLPLCFAGRQTPPIQHRTIPGLRIRMYPLRMSLVPIVFPPPLLSCSVFLKFVCFGSRRPCASSFPSLPCETNDAHTHTEARTRTRHDDTTGHDTLQRGPRCSEAGAGGPPLPTRLPLQAAVCGTQCTP
jgi:hypothetical protein